MSHDNLSAVLDRIEDIAHNDPTPESLTLGEVIDSVGRRSYGALLLVIGLFAISPITVVPGLTWFAAALTLVVAGQMAVGMPHIWLPKKALDLVLPRDVVKTGVRVSRKWAVRIDTVLKPRLMWVANLHWKVPPSFGEQGGGALYAYASAAAQNAPFAPFRWAMRELILPNFVAFGWVTVISESVLAVMLLVGYRVRLAGWAGAGMSAVIGLTVLYYPNANEWSWSYLLMMAVHLMLAVQAAWAAALFAAGRLVLGVTRRRVVVQGG